MTNTTKSATTTRTPKVGDILVSSWGYEQTNIDFYEVVKVTKSSVMLMQRNQVKTAGGAWGTGTTVPQAGVYGPVKTKRFYPVAWTKEPSYGVKIESYASAYLWDGKPAEYSSNY